MTYDTISDAVTMQPGVAGTLFAGRYRIVRQLGQGGMGSVWLAEDMQLDNKQFAIKMLPSILVSNKRAYRQLKDEALVAMQLIHPNIVQIRAFEENNGNPFLVMDYIDGETLDDYLAEVGNGEEGTGNGRAASTRPPSGGLPEGEVVRLLKPIAAALDYAHLKGVVHRDVKPGNVMIAKDGTPYILDFGIAREIQETMTRVTGKLSSGTLLYMSPEQLNGDMPTSAQDVYSFAAMVYECLKGEPPFVRGAIEDQIKNKEPSPPSPDIAISGLVMQGLAKKPEDRPKTCMAVLEWNASPRGGARARRNEDGRASAYAEATVDRERVERVETVERGVPTAPHGMSPSTSPQNRNSAGISLPIICTVAALLVLGGGLWYRGQQRKQAERRRIVAAQKVEEAARQQVQDEGQKSPREELRLALSHADFIKARQYAVEVLRVDEDDPEANFSMGMSALQLKKLDEAEIYLKRVLKRRPNEPAALNNLSIICRKQKRWKEAVDYARRAAKLLPDSPETNRTLSDALEAAREHGGQGDGANSKTSTIKCSKVQLWEGGPYWADRNIGAENPWDYGYYFWWGDTVGYKFENNKWVATDGSSANFSFTENNTPTYGKDTATLLNEGWITADNVLSAEHDAARAQWGGEWRMPTKQEMDDLCQKCDWTWTMMNDVRGYIVRGRGGYASDSIFIPCAGNGYRTSLLGSGSGGGFWSSVSYSDHSDYSWHLYFNSRRLYADTFYRSYGRSVRPVQGFTK